jgi:hypothetical protein
MLWGAKVKIKELVTEDLLESDRGHYCQIYQV